MGKFNKTGVSRVASTRTQNMAGGVSYERTSNEAELASLILNSMLNGDSFYENEEDRLTRIREACNGVDNEFVAKAMVYTRTENNLRSVSHVLANVLAENASGSPIVRKALGKAIVRPDDMTEMFAIWKSGHKGMIPNAMRRAFKDALETKFDAYQIKKYAQPRSQIKLKDIVKVAHPKDKDGIFGKLIEDKLDNIVTLDRELSAGADAGKAMSGMIAERKLGYMAALKNIRNALESGMDNEALDAWCDLISNKKRVAKSRALPFRFVDAWGAVKDLNYDRMKLNKVKTALETAMAHSVANTEILLPGETAAIAIDSSGSMGGFGRAGNTPWKNAATLAGMCYSGMPNNSVLVYTFDSNLRRIDNLGSTLDFVNANTPGGAKYLHLPLQELLQTKTVVDKVFIFTDMQMYSGWGRTDDFAKYWALYKKIAPKAKLMFWNVEGYSGGTPVSLHENDVYEMSGFSDKLLKVVPKLWKDKDALINEINKIDLN